jgi:hypothetical protein
MARRALAIAHDDVVDHLLDAGGLQAAISASDFRARSPRAA